MVAAMGVVDACFSSPARRSTPGTDHAKEYICTVVHVLRLLLETHPIPIKFCSNPISVSLRRLYIPIECWQRSFFLISRSDLLRPKLIFPPVERRLARIEINLNHSRRTFPYKSSFTFHQNITRDFNSRPKI